MSTLGSITSGLSLTSLGPTGIGSEIAIVPIADGAVQVLCKAPDGARMECLFNRGDEPDISFAPTELPGLSMAMAKRLKRTVGQAH